MFRTGGVLAMLLNQIGYVNAEHMVVRRENKMRMLLEIPTRPARIGLDFLSQFDHNKKFKHEETESNLGANYDRSPKWSEEMPDVSVRTDSRCPDSFKVSSFQKVVLIF